MQILESDLIQSCFFIFLGLTFRGHVSFFVSSRFLVFILRSETFTGTKFCGFYFLALIAKFCMQNVFERTIRENFFPAKCILRSVKPIILEENAIFKSKSATFFKKLPVPESYFPQII